MKFGDTLYQRSVPKWAAYNVNYSEIKKLIKEQTSTGLAVPVSIPSATSQNRWEPLEDDLYDILKQQYDNISLFLRSKYGEIDRRLSYLEKQVRSAQKSAELSHSNPLLQDRRHHKLLEDAESVGQDIQNLTRFAGVQKTAIRKILKKYRKWTGSTSLQARLENEVFSSGQLNLDYAHPLDRLAAQTRIIKEDLQGARSDGQASDKPQGRVFSSQQTSTTTVDEIRKAEDGDPVALDAALATIAFGKSSGHATYWIHPDNLDEAQALLLRHVREIHKRKDLSRQTSALSLASERSVSTTGNSESSNNHITYFDNPQRFVQDVSANRPSKIALSGRWCQNSDAFVTLSNLAPWNPAGTIVKVKRKDMIRTLNRETTDARNSQKQSTSSDNVQRIREYLAEHRDVKGQAQVSSDRSRYVGNSNSARVGIWATLDSNIIISPFQNERPGTGENGAESGEAFPHTVLEVRWEFCHTPELVRAFDSSHLAEMVRGFTLESAAIYAFNKELSAPPWQSLLERDIRKVPIATKLSTASRGSATRGRVPAMGTSSGPSSTEGQTESIFSANYVPSSSTSIVSPNASTRDLSSPTALKPQSPASAKKKKKKARIDAESPPPRPMRYWNEFDDGDEDANPQQAYTIYVDPNESFPGAETVSKAFGAMYRSLEGAGLRVSSMLSLKTQASPKRKARSGERSGLIGRSSRSNSDDASSSDSDTSPTNGQAGNFGTFTRSPRHGHSNSIATSITQYRTHPVLTPRQQALERAYLMTSAGLVAISYIILCICGVLVSAGRKKDIIEIDITMIAGIATAETCAVVSLILLLMRKTSLSPIKWIAVVTALAGIIAIGVVEIIAVVKTPNGG